MEPLELGIPGTPLLVIIPFALSFCEPLSECFILVPLSLCYPHSGTEHMRDPRPTHEGGSMRHAVYYVLGSL